MKQRTKFGASRRSFPTKLILALLAIVLIAGSLILFAVGGGEEDSTGERKTQPVELPPLGERLGMNNFIGGPGQLALAEFAAPEADQTSAVATVADTPAPEAIEVRREMVTIQSGDSMARIFKNLGLSATTLHRIVNLDGPTDKLTRLYPGDTVSFELVQGGDDDKPALQALRFELDETQDLRVFADASGFAFEHIARDLDIRTAAAHGRIKSSLFSAGAEAGLGDATILKFARIFGWDVDWVLDLRAGDRFIVLYEQIYRDGEFLRNGDILAARFFNRGRELTALRHKTADGDIRYYTPTGESMRKAFLRTPVDFRRISSRFNPNRLHPIHKYRRPHRGVDYAANRGTPVIAAGDGRVSKARRWGSFGNCLVIEHGNGYQTLYAHLNGFAKGVREGERVKQGQVVAYVGATGGATGPHLHYEFRVNGSHKDPLKVDLPGEPPLADSEMAGFQTQTADWLAKLNMLDAASLASSQLAHMNSGTSKK